jgi:GTP-binding protein
MEFLSVYTSQRKSLRVVFHLIDSRHGATDYDATIMNQMSRSLSKTVTYVIVLTKADKTLKGSMLAISATDPVSSVSRKILDQVRSTMKSQGIENAPVVLTSAESKLGRDALWSYMRLAADGSMDK